MSITIADLAQSRELDRQAMTAIRGGFDPSQIVIKPQGSVSQNKAVSQVFDISILNGADLSGTKGFDFNFAFAPAAVAANPVKLPTVPFV